MISDEKRREVAQKLRTLACTPDEIGITEHAVIRDLGISAGIYDDSCRSEDVLVIADLIDCKACKMDVIDTGERADYELSEHIMHCARCGAEFGYVLYSEDGDVSMDDKPNYCPYCGAEVIDEDSAN